MLFCTSKPLSETLQQILKMVLCLESNAVVGAWFFSNTMSPTLNSALFRSLNGGGHLSVAILRSSSTAIIQISHMASWWILHFLSSIYLCLGNGNVNNVGMKASHPNIK